MRASSTRVHKHVLLPYVIASSYSVDVGWYLTLLSNASFYELTSGRVALLHKQSINVGGVLQYCSRVSQSDKAPGNRLQYWPDAPHTVRQRHCGDVSRFTRLANAISSTATSHRFSVTPKSFNKQSFCKQIYVFECAPVHLSHVSAACAITYRCWTGPFHDADLRSS